MSSEAKVGLLVVAFIALIVLFSFKIGGDRLPWEDDGGYQVHVMFDSIAGLGVKSKVRYAGVEVGYVESIALDNGKARVTLRLDPDIQIRGNARFIIASMGLMGEKFVAISGGTNREGMLESDMTVQGDAAVSMDQLMASLNVIGNDIGEITGAIKSAIGSDQNQNKLERIIDNVEVLSRSLATVADENDDSMSQTLQNFQIITEELKMMLIANRENVDGTMSDVRIAADSLASSLPVITSDLQQVLSELRRILEANSNSVDTTMTHVASASEGLDNSMEDLSSIMSKVDSGRGSLGKLVNEDRFHDNLNSTLVEIKDAASEVRSFVGRVSDYRVYIGYRGEYLSNTEDFKNYVTLRVQPRPDKFYLMEMVSQPNGKRSKQRYTYDFDQSPNFVNDSGTIDYTKTTWDFDDPAMTFQIGKIYRNFVIRGGITENTGGFGADVNLFRNKLMVSVDGWDFSRDENPHFKISGRYNLGDTFYITGGWDDFLMGDENQDNVFFGAGLRFEDADLKYLLGFIPLMGN